MNITSVKIKSIEIECPNCGETVKLSGTGHTQCKCGMGYNPIHHETFISDYYEGAYPDVIKSTVSITCNRGFK